MQCPWLLRCLWLFRFRLLPSWRGHSAKLGVRGHGSKPKSAAFKSGVLDAVHGALVASGVGLVVAGLAALVTKNKVISPALIVIGEVTARQDQHLRTLALEYAL